MGKQIIQQHRGRGSPTYTSPSFNFQGESKLRPQTTNAVTGKVIDLVHCPGHSAPLMKINYSDGEKTLLIAPENIRVGEHLEYNTNTLTPGNVKHLIDIPEGTQIYNIESEPGDGGKFCRTSGTFARIVSKTDNAIIVELPSKKQRKFNIQCRAVIGVVAGGGRLEKPFLKAGKVMHAKRARNKLYPRTGASKMNAVDHPYGNKRSSRKAHQVATTHHAPPGRKVGKISPRRTGRKQ